MNQHRIDATWTTLQGHLTALWGQFSGDDSARSAGARELMSARVQKRYGLSREEANRCVKEWIHEPGVLDDWNDTRSILDM